MKIFPLKSLSVLPELYKKEDGVNNTNTNTNRYLKINFISLENKMNAAKSQLDAISADPMFRKINTASYLYEDLRMDRGSLARNFGAEKPSNAWMKSFEIYQQFLRPLLEDENVVVLNSKHDAEAPGSFILALNFMLRTYVRIIEWNWWGNTYIPSAIAATIEVSNRDLIEKRKIPAEMMKSHNLKKGDNISIKLPDRVETVAATITLLTEDGAGNIAFSGEAVDNKSVSTDTGTKKTIDWSEYLEDQYGMIAKYSDKWLLGSEGTGDITSVANIKHMSEHVHRAVGWEGEGSPSTSRVLLYTSDVKGPMDSYAKEEENEFDVHFGQFMSAITTLTPGGMMVLKSFSQLLPFSASILAVGSYCFEHLYITKPETSRPSNSEVYIVGVGYKMNIPKERMNDLYKRLSKRDFSPVCDLRLPGENRDDNNTTTNTEEFRDFMESLLEANQQRVQDQIDALGRMVDRYHKYKRSHVGAVYKDFANLKHEVARDWIKKNYVSRIDPKYNMLG